MCVCVSVRLCFYVIIPCEHKSPKVRHHLITVLLWFCGMFNNHVVADHPQSLPLPVKEF